MWQLSYETYFTHHFTFANQIIVSTLNLNFVIDINETINKQWHQQDYLLWQAFRTEYLTDPHFETNGEDDDSFLLEFEKYVSEQDVSFFSQKMDISKIISLCSCRTWPWHLGSHACVQHSVKIAFNQYLYLKCIV